MEKKKVKVCKIHDRIQKFRSTEWMRLTKDFRYYIFVSKKDEHEEVESLCDICIIVADNFFIH